MPKLGVNIDHVATLRQARREGDPDVIDAAKVALLAGADTITVHLREDRRHIQDQDVIDLKQFVPSLNLEMALSDEIIQFACKYKPTFACLVPEKREELTTEGGLDVVANESKLTEVIPKLKANGILVSLFIDADSRQIECAKKVGADIIELHTGHYDLRSIQEGAKLAQNLGLVVNAGHGLNKHNTRAIAEIPGMNELNIGHSIIARSVFIGLEAAIKEILCELEPIPTH